MRALLFWWISGPVCAGASAQWYTQDTAIMGTPVHVEVAAESPAQAEQLIQNVFDELTRIDALMSHYKPSSELSQVNREAAQHPVTVSAELLLVITRALQVSEITQGAFDITYASVGQFYNYRQRVKPDAATIAAHLPAIDYRHVQLDAVRRTVAYTHPGVRIDLGGIAKGYAVDKAIALLRQAGVQRAYVRAGGDSRFLGDKDGRPWLVGIQDPRDKSKIVARLPLRDVALSTSGDYERYFDQDGVRYHHIINPKTGRSADAVRSVTVVGKDCFTTDGLSTGLFVLGVEKGLALVEKSPGIDAVIVDNRGRLFFSAGFQRK